MNYFVLVYDRASGETSVHRTFVASERSDAMRCRFELEDKYNDDPDIEVVVLGADSRESLMRTHSRYFRSARDMIRSVQTAAH